MKNMEICSMCEQSFKNKDLFHNEVNGFDYCNKCYKAMANDYMEHAKNMLDLVEEYDEGN